MSDNSLYPDWLINEWFDLLAMCRGQEVDRKLFRTLHDQWARRWGRMSFEVQGWVSQQIAAGLRS